MQRRIDFHGRLDGRTELGDGSVRFTARLTRTGVFDYGDHKELRTDEEVFKPEALDSFKGLAVTDGHVAWIDAENWKTHAKGHIGDDVRAEPPFVVASVIVKDKGMLAKIDAKERVEISMGYSVDLENTPGRTDGGEEYDSIQKNILGNHAALGPSNWGRAGSAARLLDGLATQGPDGVAYASGTMAEKRIDAPSNDLDVARADAASARADADAVRKERDAARAERDDAKKRADTLEAERDAARKDASDAKNALEQYKKDADARVDARIALVDAARSILGKDFDAKGKSDREVRVATILKVDSAFKADDKSDDYIAARFDLTVEQVKGDQNALSQVNEVSTSPAPKKSKIDEAYERADEEARKAHEAGPPAGAMVRKA